MISFPCPQCRQTLQAKKELSGQEVKCPHCGQVIPVPLTASAGVPSQPPPASKAAAAPGPTRCWVADRENRATLLPAEAAYTAEVWRDTHSDSLEASQETTGSGSVVAAELTDFLAPAQGPGELGRLGPYRVLKVLGHGGMGVVYEAEDPQLQRRVALKVMLPTLAASATSRERFLREARAAAAIEHDHIVAIYQVGEDRGVPFLAMPFLQGEPLDERLKREGKLPVAEVLRIGRETAEGLEAAHAKGLIHRDIKPGNLWLEASPGRKSGEHRVKILDFGLARSVNEAGPQLTRSGAILGTPAYMAPEQATGQKTEARCDLFSLGCVLYQLSTGKLPFKGADTISTLMAVATENPPSPQTLNPEISTGLSDLVMALLAKKPGDRPPGARAVVETIQDLESQGPGTAVSASPRRQNRIVSPGTDRGPGRRRRRLLAAAAVVLVGAIVGGYFALNSSDEEPARPNAGKAPKPGLGPKVVVAPAPEDRKPAVPPPGKLFAGPTPFDALRPEAISPAALAAAGWVAPGKPLPELVGILGNPTDPDEAFAAVDVAPDGRVLAVLTRGGTLQFWDVATWTRLSSLPPMHESPWPNLCYNRDGTLLAVTASGGRVILRDANRPKGGLLHSFPGSSGDHRCMAFSPDGKLLAVGRSGAHAGDLILYATTTGRPVLTLLEGPAHVSAVAFSPNNRTLAASYYVKDGVNAMVKLWDATTGNSLRILLGKGLHQKRLQLKRPAGSLAFSPDGKWLLSTHHYCSDLFLFGLEGIRPARAFVGHQDWATSAVFSPDGRLVASSARNGEVKVWDAQTREVRKTFLLGQGPPKSTSPLAGQIRRVLFSPDGRHLLALHGTGVLSVLRLAPPPRGTDGDPGKK